MAEKERILVVDDEPSIRKYLQTLLEVDGFDVETVSSGREALNKVKKGERPDFIILDVLMPEMNGIDTLTELMEIDRTLNVIMLSCSNEVGTVVEAIRIGAHDYLTKPFEKTELDAAMLKSRQKKQLATENQALRDYCDQVTEDLSFLAASPQMVRIRQQILQIAPVDVPVFICGESGVGKEVVARMIHLRSKRRNQAFVKVNCAALPGELLESELFGFEQFSRERYEASRASLNWPTCRQNCCTSCKIINIPGWAGGTWWRRTCACSRQPTWKCTKR